MPALWLWSSLIPNTRSPIFSGADDPPRTQGADEELILPGILDGFSVRVGRFFE